MAKFVEEALIDKLVGDRSVIEDLMSWGHLEEGAAKQMGSLVAGACLACWY